MLRMVWRRVGVALGVLSTAASCGVTRSSGDAPGAAGGNAPNGGDMSDMSGSSNRSAGTGGTADALAGGGTEGEQDGGTAGFGASASEAGSQGSNESAGADTTEGGAAPACTERLVHTANVTPTVLLLIDNSASMFEPRATDWDRLYEVLMKPTDGVVASLQDKLRFGFTSYRGSGVTNAPSCPELFEVDYNLDNFAAIDAVYQARGAEYVAGRKWQTPTGAAIKKVAAELAAYQAQPSGPKYIVLVTDGDPDTCAVLDPKCGSDESIQAVQAAKAAGIGTFAVGIGDMVAGGSGCDPAWGRCGALHLQDLANAGQGLPVAAPPDNFKYLPCTPTQTLAAKYAGAAEAPGAAPYVSAATALELQTGLNQLLGSLVSCTFETDVTVVGDPAAGTVEVDGTARAYGSADGWKLEADRSSITLQGTACTDFQTHPKAKLAVRFPCAIALPR